MSSRSIDARVFSWVMKFKPQNIMYNTDSNVNFENGSRRKTVSAV